MTSDKKHSNITIKFLCIGLLVILLIIYYYCLARQRRGEGEPATAADGRVDARCIEAEVVCVVNIRISPNRPSVTAEAGVPQMTDDNVDESAANLYSLYKFE